MKTKIIFFSAFALLLSSISFAQKNLPPKSIIQKVSINRYHEKEELQTMQKGELLTLYIQRIDALVKTLPNIAFATKPGVTMATIGIPDSDDNRDALDEQHEATLSFLEKTISFQKNFLPYSDKSNLIAAILFYEETFKMIHEFSEFN